MSDTHSLVRWSSLGLALLVASASAVAADATAGKKFFRGQCALCHSAQPDDDGGAQGPDLNGVFGRKAASQAAFSYTPALRNSNLTWDAATLDRFLTSPTTVVPGSAMVVAVPDQQDRANLIAYFQAVKAGTFVEPGAQAKRDAPAATPTPKGTPEWKDDAPGRVHHVQVEDLAAPFATPSARNFPRFVSKPANASLKVPEGFSVNVFATGLDNPRTMRVAPNGDVFVAETSRGRIKVMRPSADGATAATIETFARGLDGPFGIQFYPADNPQWLYVGELNRVVRYAYQPGAMKATGVPEVVVSQLAPHANGGHTSRDIAFSADGKRMFVSVGSESNVAESMSKKSATEIAAWEAQHGLGAAWDNETNRAVVLVFPMDVKAPGKIFASGIRNCVGLTRQPGTDNLWCTTNERDLLGDNLVPDYSTRVKEGGYYGWPWYYIGNHEDPRLKDDRPDLAGKATVPDVLYQAHSAAITLTFYPANSGKSAFPKEYVGDGFTMLHGSWNRAFRTGHKVVRVRMKDGVPTGEYEDFMVGFITEDGNAWGRPAGGAVAADGSLLVSDDTGNVIYRISYAN
ncbi:MAG TPA: PQQ-dependent sugar dehydrogenase [Povalibacter sp.]|nr:PQQ-dependent sugar dehydrogenase [Povalibacter sp.]